VRDERRLKRIATMSMIEDARATMARIPDVLGRCRRLALAAALVFAGALAATAASAQQVVVMVGGEPITALDVEQRIKLTVLSTQKAPSRQEVIEELINERLKIREGKRWGLEVANSEVDQAYATMAGRMRMTADGMTQTLAKSGIHPGTLKSRIRADLVWSQLVRGRYQSSLQVNEKDLLTATKEDDAAGYDYTLRPILFIVPPGSPEAVIEARKREAEGLRNRFNGCDEGIAFARGLKDIAVRDQIVRSSADIPEALRKVLEGIEVGRLSAPEVTKYGVEVYAVCAKKESTADNTIGKRKARDSIFAARYEERSKKYLEEIRRSAMIEYR
jgi:peptidyl-prolyl cis-trans isomerase SurA